jgi:hypothetical protein
MHQSLNEDPLVSEGAICDPFLGAIDNPVFTVLSLNSLGLETTDITASKGYGMDPHYSLSEILVY